MVEKLIDFNLQDGATTTTTTTTTGEEEGEREGMRVSVLRVVQQGLILVKCLLAH